LVFLLNQLRCMDPWTSRQERKGNCILKFYQIFPLIVSSCFVYSMLWGNFKTSFCFRCMRLLKKELTPGRTLHKCSKELWYFLSSQLTSVRTAERKKTLGERIVTLAERSFPSAWFCRPRVFQPLDRKVQIWQAALFGGNRTHSWYRILKLN
jgi:hypothetical protein